MLWLLVALLQLVAISAILAINTAESAAVAVIASAKIAIVAKANAAKIAPARTNARAIIAKSSNCARIAEWHVFEDKNRRAEPLVGMQALKQTLQSLRATL